MEVRGPGVEEGQLAEHVRGPPHDGDEAFAAVGGATADLHLSVDDDVEPVAGIAFGENGVPVRELDRIELVGEGGHGVVGEALEYAGSGQDLDAVHGLPPV